MNIYQKNIINIDCSLSSIKTNKGLIDSTLPIKISTDTDPASINIQDSFYMFGNTTMDLYADTIQTTLLQINNNNVSGAEIVTIYDNGDAPPPPPTECNCYRLATTNAWIEYSYTDCSGVYIWNRKDYMQPIYVSASDLPEVPGGTVTLVDSSYCSI